MSISASKEVAAVTSQHHPGMSFRFFKFVSPAEASLHNSGNERCWPVKENSDSEVRPGGELGVGGHLTPTGQVRFKGLHFRIGCGR